MTDSKPTSYVGDDFEKIVSQHYEALGYSVVRNIMINHHQVDMLASKYVSGAGLINVMIEAKYRGASLGINEVRRFLDTAESLQKSGKIQNAVLVTSAKISDKAQGEAARRGGSRLVSLEELRQDLFNFSESLMKSKAVYEDSSIYKEYIPLSAKSGSFLGSSKDISKNVLEIISSKNHRFLVIVGDFGSGKSTLMRRMFYMQSCLCQVDAAQYFPIYLNLNKLLNFDDLWEFVIHSLKEEQYISPPQAIVKSLMDQGRFLFFLDGFDEIHTGANASDRAEYLNMLGPIITSSSPCILATRPTYFESLEEMKKIFRASLAKNPNLMRVNIPGFDFSQLFKRSDIGSAPKFDTKQFDNIIEVKSLTRDDVLHYIYQFKKQIYDATSLTPEQMQEKIEETYDLSDLMSRPLLLNMVVTTIIGGGLKLFGKDERVGPSTVYEIYTQMTIERDITKRSKNHQLSTEQVLSVCRQLALTMLRTNSLELTPDILHNAVRSADLSILSRSKKTKIKELTERILTEIRLCSFLIFSEDGRMRFAHKSFSEFFIAQYIIVNWQKDYNTIDSISDLHINKEIIYFLASFAREHDSIQKMIINYIKFNPNFDSITSNLLRKIAFTSGLLLNNLEVKKGTLSGVDVQRTNVVNSIWESIKFENVLFRSSCFDHIDIRNCVGVGLNFEEIAFLNSQISFNNGDINIYQCRFNVCTVDFFCTADIKGTTFDGGNIRIGGKIWPTSCDFVNCASIIIGKRALISGSGSLNINHSIIVGAEIDKWYDRTCNIKLENCLVIGAWISSADIISMADNVSKSGRSGLHISDCRGFVFSEDTKNPLESEERSEISKRHPNLILCDITTVRSHLNIAKTRGIKHLYDNAESFDYLIKVYNYIISVKRKIKISGLSLEIFDTFNSRPNKFR